MEIVTLAEVCEFLDNQRKPITAKDRVVGPYPYFGANGVLDYVNDYLFDEELVLLAEDGGFFDAPERGVAYRVSGKCWVNNHAHVLRPKKNIDVNYLGYVLKQYDIRSYVTGATVKKITQKAARQLRIPLPSIEEQKRIVRELDSADALRQKRKQAIALLDDYLKALFLEMFGDPVTNPKGWSTRSFLNLCLKILGGGTPSKSNVDFYTGKMAWITPKDMKCRFLSNSEDHISEEAIKNSSVKLIPQKSVLMVVRSGILKHTLPVAINDVEVTINQDMKAFVVDLKVSNPYFVLFFFEVYQKHLLKKVRAVTADNLKFDDIKNIETIVPPLELQDKFAEIVLKTEKLKQKMLAQFDDLETNFNALMQKIVDSN
jgi:type I restriction enzyme S subunit